MESLHKLSEYQVCKGPINVEDIHILVGSNYFSGGPVVRFRINLGEYDEVFTNDIPAFFEKLKAGMPSLYEHFCSPGKPGGFFERVQEGTLLGHVMEHVAIEFQTLGGMDVGFGKTRTTKVPGVYNVVFRYFDELAGIYAGKASVNFINSLLMNKSFDIEEIVEKLIYIREKRLLGPSTQAIVDEAERRDIPHFRIDKYNQVQLGTGKNRRIIRATTTDRTSLIAVETADNKFITTGILKEAGIPVPERVMSDNFEVILSFFVTVGKPVVLKPLDGYQGKRVSVNIQDQVKLKSAFDFVMEFDDYAICQEFIPGNTYRLLVINNRFVAAVKVIPPYITGDGESTVNTLIDHLNADPQREAGDKGKLTKVEVDEDTMKILELRNLTLDSALNQGEMVYLKNSGNMRLGGSSEDVTELVHTFNIFIAERISLILNLDVAGIDIITPDISTPIIENGGKVIEVNAAPDFRMHFNPTTGTKRNVQNEFVNMLFPENAVARIPIISVTGSKGKNAAVRMMDHALRKAGYKNGVVRSDGLFLDGVCLKKTDMTNAENQQIVLKDPTVECAIFETPVEMILDHGIGYKFADIGLVLNLFGKDEYFGYDHIRDLEDVAYAKSVVAEEVYEKGTSILNADDPLVYTMSERLYSKLILFSKYNDNECILRHINKNGIAFIYENEKIIRLTKFKKTELLEIQTVPFLKEFKEDCYLDALLASVAALITFGLKAEEIADALADFA